MTDAELLLRVQRGDLTAWKLLYARCLPTVWRYASAFVSDGEAEEIVSEVFLALVRSLPTLDADVVHLHGWLRAVVQHKAADHGRKSFRNKGLPSVLRDEVPGGESCQCSTSLEIEETRQEVLAILEQLPDIQRLVLEWKHAEELSVREIASRLGQSEKSVESLLYRARKEFRRLYTTLIGADGREAVAGKDRAGTLEKSM